MGVDETSTKVGRILEDFSYVFKELDQLPPKSDRDHQIHLEDGAKLVNVRPYCHPQFKKSKMETIVKELLHKGFIHASRNPFSSPVILVKKKNGGWSYVLTIGHYMQ